MSDSIMFTINSWYILVPIYFVFFLVAIAKLLKGSFTFGQFVLVSSFAFYLSCVIHLVLFPIHVNIGKYANLTPWYNSINFIPVLTIDIKTFLMNVIMLVPFGMYLPLLLKNLSSWRKAAFLGFLVSLSFEGMQLLIRAALGSGRSTDVNDLIANALGAAIGFWLVKLITEVPRLNSFLNKLRLKKAL